MVAAGFVMLPRTERTQGQEAESIAPYVQKSILITKHTIRY